MVNREVQFFVVAFSVAALFFIASGALTVATSSGTNSTANLTIYDQTDSEGGGLTMFSLRNLTFFANFTNATGAFLNWTQGNATCTARYNFTGDYTSGVNMTFNSLLLVWQHNRTFTYKGVNRFTVNCTSTYGNVSVTDIFNISNSAPHINVKSGSYIDIDGNDLTSDSISCTEDTVCTYNFTQNVTDNDANDVLTYSYNLNSNASLANFTFNTTTGILLINVTTNITAGNKEISLIVNDTGDGAGNGLGTDSGILRVSIASVNDAPLFSNLQNQTFNASTLFNYTLLATDEENNTPYTLNISFLNCSVMPWSTRNCSTTDGRALFNSTYYTFDNLTGTINITFTPTRNDVGNYTINFTLGDSGTNAPVNANVSQVVTFFVSNVNTAPYFRYTCANEHTATEDSLFTSCTINVSDIDETNNVTLGANQSWFFLDGTATNSSTKSVNSGTSYNATFIVNFTANDSLVGNWTINLTLTDLGNPSLSNSTLINFSISNVQDSDFLESIANLTAYTTNNYTIYVNASDDDLRVPDKRVYNETLVFYSNFSCVSVGSFGVVSGTNISQARVHVNATDSSCFTGGQNYSVRISVNDSGNYSSFSRVFIIRALSNNLPQWNVNQSNFTLTENTSFYLNLSKNASDTQNDALTFTFINDTSFASFSLTSAGIINFTPTDDDIGLHYVTVNVSDGPSSSPLIFNFTVVNINDAPVIDAPITADNASVVGGNSNVSAVEDNQTVISLSIHDNDLRIPAGQRVYYNETLTLNVTIFGPNTTILHFVKSSTFPTTPDTDPPGPTSWNKTLFTATFTPKKTDIGNYSILLNVSDASNVTTVLRFNMSIIELNHRASLNVSNQTAVYNQTWFYDINASDSEDGNESTGNLTFSYSILTNTSAVLTSLLNASGAFNTTTGNINITFNHTAAGVYRINITVRDTGGLNASSDFTLIVYGNPVISLLTAGTNVTFVENNQSNTTFLANHTVADNLSYYFYIRNELKYAVNYSGNSTNLTWSFTPNYTDETHGTYANLTLWVLNPIYATANATQTWNVNITHTNSPVNLTTRIPNQSATIGSTISYDLTSYFLDADATDVFYNQSVSYTLARANSSSGISTVLSGTSLNFTRTTSAANELFNVTANETLTESVSNQFFVNFSTAAASSSSSSSTSGGGGGGGGVSSPANKTKPVSLKLVLPDPFSMTKKDKIIIPITLQNTGTTILNGISLTSFIAKNGKLQKDVRSTFDRSTFVSLSPGAEEKVKLTFETNTEDAGLYEITINATVDDPVFSDWGKIFLTVKEGVSIDERILFTEEFIVGNPECAEIKELVDDARLALARGDVSGAEVQVAAALDSCKKAISQQSGVLEEQKKNFLNSLLNYASIATVAAFILGFIYYSYRRVQLRRIPGAQVTGFA